MLKALARINPFTRASATTRIDVEATRGADAIWTTQSFEALAREGYEQAVWAYACARVLMTQAQNYRPILHRITRDGDTEVHQHPLLDLLASPNAEQSLAEWIAAAYGFTLVGGNTYIEGVALGPSSPPVELWLKRPDRMRVIPDATNRIGGYEYRVGGQAHRFEPWEILHLKTWAPLDEWYGMSPLAAAARGVDTFNAGQAHNLALLQNGARPTGAWVSQGSIDQSMRERIKAELREAAQLGRRGRTLVLEGGVSWQELGIAPKDMDWLEGQTDAARQIHAAYGVHPVLTGLQQGTFENQDQALRSVVVLTVFPWLEAFTARLNRWLVPRFGTDLRLDFDRDAFPAISEDQDSLWTRATNGWSKGVLTRDEARLMLGFETIGGDRGEIFVSELYAGRTPVASVLPPSDTTTSTDDGEERASRYRRGFHLATEHDRALYWRGRVTLQERWEAQLLDQVRGVFEAERAAIAARAETAATADDLMLIATLEVANHARWDALLPTMLAAMIDGGQSVLDTLETEDRAAARRAQRQELPTNALLQQTFGLVFQETIDVALAHMPKLVGELSTTTLERVAQRIAIGASEGLSVPGIAASIDELYLDQIIPNRSTVIARTEIIRSTNYGGQQAARGTGLELEKTWVTSMDGRQRDAHGDANMQTRPIDALYDVGISRLMYPGDPGGEAEDIIQCRCTEIYSEVTP